MTVAEMEFLERVPYFLKEIAHELKRANELKEVELGLKNKEKEDDK